MAMVRKMELDSYDFVVENYSAREQIGVGNAIRSDEFAIAGHRWEIQFFPEGKTGDGDEGYASLYVVLMSESAGPVHLLASLYIVDQSGGNNDCCKSSFCYNQVRRLTRGGTVGSSRFIRRSLLSSGGYLKGDSLKIGVCIGVFTYRVRNLLQPGAEEASHDEYVFFQVADRRRHFHTFCATKGVLADRCPALFPRPSDRDVVVDEIEPRIFEVVLSFIYKGVLNKIDEEAMEESDPSNLGSFAAKLLAAADKLKLSKLKEICESSISKKVNENSIAYLLPLANVCHATQLRAACMIFAAENQSAVRGSSVVMKTPGFEHLKETFPLLLFDLDGYGEKPSPRKGAFGMWKEVIPTSLKKTFEMAKIKMF